MDHIGVCAGGDLFHVRFADVELAAYDAGSWDRVGCRTRTVNNVACRHRSRIARIMILLTAKSVHFRFVIMRTYKRFGAGLRLQTYSLSRKGGSMSRTVKDMYRQKPAQTWRETNRQLRMPF
jgi:hypothetical protein